MSTIITELPKTTAADTAPDTTSADKKAHHDFLDRKLEIEPKFVKKEKNFVLLNVPVGKPNRKRTSEKDPLFVRQGAQKGDTCYYYSLKMNSMLQPDYLQTQCTEERKIASEYRKEKSLSALTYTWLEVLLDNLNGPLTKEAAIQYLQKHLNSDLPESISKHPKVIAWSKDYNFRIKLSEFIDNFQKSSETNIENYIRDCRYKDRISAAFTFLRRSSNQDPIDLINENWNNIQEQLYVQARKIIEIENAKNIEQFDLRIKTLYLQSTAEMQLDRIFKVKTLEWNPVCHDINHLFDLLEKNGSPLIATGYFGAKQYTQPPKTVDSVAHYQIQGFPKNTKKEINFSGGTSSMAHTINVIGVQKNSEKTDCAGWIYYSDPDTACDPKDKNAKRIIFKISYEQFCKALANTTPVNLEKTDKTKGLRYLKTL